MDQKVIQHLWKKIFQSKVTFLKTHCGSIRWSSILEFGQWFKFLFCLFLCFFFLFSSLFKNIYHLILTWKTWALFCHHPLYHSYIWLLIFTMSAKRLTHLPSLFFFMFTHTHTHTHGFQRVSLGQSAFDFCFSLFFPKLLFLSFFFFYWFISIFQYFCIS